MNDGYINEIKIAKYINGKKFNELNYIYQDMLKKLYKKINENEIVYCQIDPNKKKYDIIISINSINKYISIKKGYKNSFHTERLNTFVPYLKSIGIKQKIIDYYLHFHYADGTINGKGRYKLSTEEYKIENQSKIDIINQVLKNKYIVKKLIERCVTKGTNIKNNKIDGILHGNEISFTFYTTKEIEKLILYHIKKKSTGVHFSCLFLSPIARNLNENKKYIDRKHIIQIKWYNMHDDFIIREMEKAIKKTKSLTKKLTV